jgi:hypothetical protein
MQRVAVTGQPVQQGLLRPGRLLDPQVRFAPGKLPAIAPVPRAALAAEPALAADERAARAGQERLPGLCVDRHGLGDHQRAGALVVDPGDGRGGPRRPRHRQRPVQLEGLLGVDQHGRVEGAKRAPGPAAPGDQHPERRQHLLLDPRRVLGGELQLAQRVTQARADRDRIQQRVGRRPRALLRLARHPDETVVKRHNDLRS